MNKALACQEVVVLDTAYKNAFCAMRCKISEDIGLVPHWTLSENRLECEGMTDVGRVSVMDVDGKTFVAYDQNSF